MLVISKVRSQSWLQSKTLSQKKKKKKKMAVLFTVKIIYFSGRTTFAGCWWLTPINLATQQAEIRRITV
jgi:hypothetical protein